MLNIFKEMMVTGLGAIFFTKDKLEELVQEMVEQGSISREEAANLVDDMVAKAKEQREDLKEKIKSEINVNLDRTGLANKDEVKKLKQKVNQLELHIKSLEKEVNELKTNSIETVDDDS